MKIRIINSKDEINTLDQTEKFVHLAFRPSNRDILIMVQMCPKLKAIHIPRSYESTISNTTYLLLEMKNIVLLNGDAWGQKSDIIKYYETKPWIIERIKALKKDGESKEKIISILSKESNLNTDLIKLLL